MVKDLIFISNARHINNTIHTILDLGDMHELYSMLIENHYLFIYSTVLCRRENKILTVLLIVPCCNA